MAEKYYDATIYDSFYPTIVKSILEALKVYICGMLYPDEDFNISGKRFILTDFSPGDEIAIRKSVETFKTVQGKFPFTAYGLNDREIDLLGEKTSFKEKSGIYYSNIHGAYIKSVPSKLTIPMVSFFSTAADYEKAYHIIMNDVAVVNRINIPIRVYHSTTEYDDTFFPILFNLEVSKGAFAYQFDEYLRTGNIWGLVHNFVIEFRYYAINANDSHGNTLRIAPVDDIIASFYTFNNPDYRDNPILQNVMHAYAIPEVTTTTPTEGSTNFDRSYPIIINFNTGMDEDSVINAIDSNPFISSDYVFNNTSTQLYIDPVSDLQANTLYTITISTNAKSGMDQNLENDFVLTFTTGV